MPSIRLFHLFAIACFTLALTLGAPANAVDDEEPEGWTGKFRLGGSIKEGNNDSASLDVDGEIGRAWERDSLNFFAHFGYGTADGNKNKDEQSLIEDYKHFFSEMFYLTVNAQQERDAIQAIDIRLLSSVGPGWRVYKWGPKRYLDIETGVGHRYERFDTGENRSDATARFAAELSHKFEQNIELKQNLSFLLPLTDTNSWLAKSLTYIALPVSESWFFTNSLGLEWLNQPAVVGGVELKEFDLTYTVALEYRF